MRKQTTNDDMKAVFLVLTSIGTAFTVFGFWPPVIILAIAVVVFSVKSLLALAEKKRELNAPCQHGVISAKRHPEKCTKCTEAKLQSEELERQQQTLELQKLEQQRAEWKREFSENLRRKDFLRSMNPLAFERLVCRLYSHMGYEVETTPGSGDWGADGFLTKEGIRCVLQCKRVQNSVGQPILRDLYGTMMHFRCQAGIVVTTGSVSSAAREWAIGKPITIIEINQLLELFRRHCEFIVNDEFLSRGVLSTNQHFQQQPKHFPAPAEEQFPSSSVRAEKQSEHFSLPEDPDIEAALALFAATLIREEIEAK